MKRPRPPLGGAFVGVEAQEHHLGAMQLLQQPMRRYADDDEIDYLIVGVGAGGGVLLQRLARAGFRVAGLEAGPFWDTERDWVSDEAGSHQLYWEDLRITGGDHPLALGANNSGKGVGGGSVHWAAFTPRLHPSDFEVYSRDGVGVDWPLSYQELKPYYELLELEMPVSGPAWFPWGDPHAYAFGPHPLGGVGNALVRGCTALGIEVSADGPVAILSGSRGAWGWGLRRVMMDYNHWAAFGLLGEILPHADNRVTLADERDRFGLPVVHVHFSLHDNDHKLIAGARQQTEEVMRAAGASEIAQEARYAHLVGAARMGSDPATSVVDKFGRSHDIANLFICDGSVFPTQGSANPGLTIQSLAARCADYLVSRGASVFASDRRDLTPPTVRRDLSPPGTQIGGARVLARARGSGA
ncbi:MAG: GMC family oxidoreductase [Propionivibrio sp.]